MLACTIRLKLDSDGDYVTQCKEYNFGRVSPKVL